MPVESTDEFFAEFFDSAKTLMLYGTVLTIVGFLVLFGALVGLAMLLGLI